MGDGPWTPPAGWTLQALPERAKRDALPTTGDAIAEIHARWLMTPRDDLQGRAPREILLAQRHHIDLDLDHRSQQWSMLRQCPPGIETDTFAYRFGGFGSHENLMYYDLVRHLLAEAWVRVVQPSEEPELAGSLSAKELAREAPGRRARFINCRQAWFESPCEDAMSFVTPAALIDLERRRIPFAASGKEHMIDCDCPTCEMMAEGDFGPMFIHFDGCNIGPAWSGNASCGVASLMVLVVSFRQHRQRITLLALLMVPLKENASQPSPTHHLWRQGLQCQQAVIRAGCS